MSGYNLWLTSHDYCFLLLDDDMSLNRGFALFSLNVARPLASMNLLFDKYRQADRLTLIIIYSTFSFCLNSWLGGTCQLSRDSTALSCLFYLDCSASGLWFKLGLWCKWQWQWQWLFTRWTDHLAVVGAQMMYRVFCEESPPTTIKPKQGAAAYQLGNTSSRTITEVKQRWARLVLGWDTVQVLPKCCC